MMGPWLIFATLLNRAAMALFAQTPIGRPFGEFVQDAHVSMLGCVPSLVCAWRTSACMHGLDWSRIRAFSSSGECSNPEDMLYLMHLAGYRPIIEYCGGTEIGGAYITSTVVQPNIPAAFSTPAFGRDLAIWLTTAGPPLAAKSSIPPSMGLYHSPQSRPPRGLLRQHSPTAPGPVPPPPRRPGATIPQRLLPRAGRSDDTMNLGGIKVGALEIEEVVRGVEGVAEAAAVAVSPRGEDRACWSCTPSLPGSRSGARPTCVSRCSRRLPPGSTRSSRSTTLLLPKPCPARRRTRCCAARSAQSTKSIYHSRRSTTVWSPQEAFAMQERVMLITGAGSGIGRGLAELAAGNGWRVIVTDLDGRAADETAGTIAGKGGRAEPSRWT